MVIYDSDSKNLVIPSGLGNLNNDSSSGETYLQGYADGVNAQKAKLSSIEIVSNGNYSKSDGYSAITVSVDDTAAYESGYTAGENAQKAKLSAITITENGEYTADDGYSAITVSISGSSSVLQDGYLDIYPSSYSELTGTYEPDEGFEGFSKVDYNLEHTYSYGFEQGKSYIQGRIHPKYDAITTNGVYEISDEEGEGWNKVVVNVPSSESEKYDYTKMGVSYVMPSCPIAVNVSTEYYITDPSLTIMAVIKCDTDGRIYNYNGSDGTIIPSQYASTIKYTTSKVGDDDYYLVGDFLTDNYYPVWYFDNNKYLRHFLNSNSNLWSISIGEKIETLEDSLNYCSNLRLITSFAFTAPALEDGCFSGVYSYGVLRVPNGATGYDAWLSVLGDGWTIEYME